MVSVVRTRKVWFFLSGALVAVSVFVFFFWGLRLGIDFTGGSLLELTSVEGQIDPGAVRNVFAQHSISVQVQRTDTGVLVRFSEVDESTHQELLTSIAVAIPGAEEARFESIGPAIGAELKEKTVRAIVIALVAILLYVAYAFRKVSRPVASWKYGAIALIALFHDIAIVIGLFVILGTFYNVEVNATFIAALLTVLGYSVNDTIVVFDRVRENIRVAAASFSEILDKSVRETFARSINTSLTTLLALLAVFFFGGASVKSFALALMAGIVIGTYSSIFLATPLLLFAQRGR